MPFQAIPIAFRSNPGGPVAKLALIYLVMHADVSETSGPVDFQLTRLAEFAQVGNLEALDALRLLERQKLLKYCHELHHSGSDEWTADVALPLSWRDTDERKRTKATVDQIDALLEHSDGRCVTCGQHGPDVEWHIDHIIPRSVGGADVEANCQAICSQCNSRKGARVHWLDFLGGRK